MVTHGLSLLLPLLLLFEPLPLLLPPPLFLPPLLLPLLLSLTSLLLLLLLVGLKIYIYKISDLLSHIFFKNKYLLRQFECQVLLPLDQIARLPLRLLLDLNGDLE